MTIRGVKFHRAMVPYEAGDIVGLPVAHARKLVDRGIAAFHPPVAAVPEVRLPDILDAMDRAGLVAFSKEKMGVADEPAADVGDDALREVIRAHVDPADLVPASEPPTKPKKG